MRAFLAIPIPAALQPLLCAAGENFADLRRAPASNLHLTIKFLGEIRKPVDISEAVEPVCARHAPFEVALGRLGCFPSPRKASVVWVGLTQGDLQAGALVQGIERALEPFGIPDDGRPWRGHVTLGRYAKPRKLREKDLDADAAFGTFRAESVVLFSSELRPDGPVYTPIHTLPLGGVSD
ncbi:MAG: RNA 2',3'-cyclic phosphodiesterase [Planctomycetota bacterium]